MECIVIGRSHFKGHDLQDWAIAHDLKWRFHLPHNLHCAGPIDKENEILKQRIKLLTGKTTLAGRTKVLFQTLIHLSDQRVGPVILYARLGTLRQSTQYHKVMKILRSQHCPNSHCGSMWYAAENTKSHHPLGKGVVYWNL